LRRMRFHGYGRRNVSIVVRNPHMNSCLIVIGSVLSIASNKLSAGTAENLLVKRCFFS
jgi:hypothetical protein